MAPAGLVAEYGSDSNFSKLLEIVTYIIWENDSTGILGEINKHFQNFRIVKLQKRFVRVVLRLEKYLTN